MMQQVIEYTKFLILTLSYPKYRCLPVKDGLFAEESNPVDWVLNWDITSGIYTIVNHD